MCARTAVALSPDAVLQTWPARALDPEMACAASWSDACRTWWVHPTDRRLRLRVLDQLFMDEDELAEWQGIGLDEASLVRAHAHVTAMRAGVERNRVRRTLVSGSLRTHAVVAHLRGGELVRFAPVEELPTRIAELAKASARLPANPFPRAAWIIQAFGAVHPFRDGNGGTSRFLSSLELSRAWFPPLVLTGLQRNSTYIDALLGAETDLGPLQQVTYDVVQQELAALLVAGDVTPAEWDEPGCARADTWTAIVDGAWRAAVELPVVMEEGTSATLARFARRGYRISAVPRPRLARWAIASPLPVLFELVISPARAADAFWMVASVEVSLGEDGALGSLLLHEPIARVFVAPPTESDATALPRFERWLATRIAQCVRGLALWI